MSQILRRLVVPGNPTILGPVAVLQFNSLIRVLGIAVQVLADSNDKPAMRWRVASKDGNITLPNVGAETLAPVVGIAELWAMFLVNQQRDVPPEVAGAVPTLAPGFLPPDLWLLPSEIVVIEFGGETAGLAAATIAQVIVSYLDSE